jgi:type IV pilus assembly protein PilQ
LQAKLDGRTLLVGDSVSGKTFGPQMSKVYRLNQASAASAADYLASLGVQINKVTVVTTQSDKETAMVAGATGGIIGGNPYLAVAASFSDVETYGASTGPLRGLTGTTDSRLETVTLVGDSKLIAVAEGYLKQIDLRQRQVAVKVQILNIDLLNDKSIDSSFSARIGNTFIVSESGNAFINFGKYKPGNSAGTGALGQGSAIAEPGTYETSIPDNAGAFVEQKTVVSPFVEKLADAYTVTDPETGQVTVVEVPFINSKNQKEYVPDPNPNASSQLVPVYDRLGRPIYVPSTNPADNPKDNNFTYPNNSFYGYLEAVIQSSSAKTLASPTLLVQEGESAQVETGTSVITGVNSTETANGSTQFENTRRNAGLTLQVNVSKIDDNGFVTLNLLPSVSVPQPAGTQQGVPIFNITKRSLNSGSVRLRDRQTLVLTGVIQDSDRETVRKWPILGDLPFIGQMFRSSDSQREKQELVILVTPSIVDDDRGGSYGYGYRPSSREARQLMGSS